MGLSFIQRALQRLRWSISEMESFFCEHYVRVILAICLEVAARFVEGLTFYLAFSLLGQHLSLLTSALLDVGRTLFDNIFFFIPYQVGSREQGVLVLLEQVFGQETKVYLSAAFLYRLVEVIWVLVGYVLWVIHRNKFKSSPRSETT